MGPSRLFETLAACHAGISELDLEDLSLTLLLCGGTLYFDYDLTSDLGHHEPASLGVVADFITGDRVWILTVHDGWVRCDRDGEFYPRYYHFKLFDAYKEPVAPRERAAYVRANASRALFRLARGVFSNG